MEIVKEFGIQPILLAAQVVNFLILLFLLKRFLYKPLLKVLDERKQKIADSIKNAAEIEERLAEVAEEQEKKLMAAAKEAAVILAEANKLSNQIIQEAHAKAAVDIKKMMEKSEQQMALRQMHLKDELKLEIAGLVIKGFETVADKVLTGKDQKNLVERSIKGIM